MEDRTSQIYLGGNNKITNSKISNEIVNIKNPNHKASILKQVIVGIIVSVVAGIILFYFGIK